MSQSAIRTEESFHDEYVKRHQTSQKAGKWGGAALILAVAVLLIAFGAFDVLVKLALALGGLALLFGAGVLFMGAIIFFVFTAAASTTKKAPRIDEGEPWAWTQSPRWDPVRRTGYFFGTIETLPSRMAPGRRWYGSASD